MGILLNKAKNFIINGAFDYWQRGTSFAAVTAGTYTADRFQYQKAGTMVHTVSRDIDVPTINEAGIVLPYSLRLNLTTPQASISAAHTCDIRQYIEGSILAGVAGKTTTLSFWVKATLTGTYCISFRSPSARSYVKTYVISAANTWEKKSITVPWDSGSTFTYDTSAQMTISWALATGSNFQSPSDGVWVAGNYLATSAQVNGVAAGSTDFRIAGIQLEEGLSASNFERAGVSIIDELQLCQRYYEKSYNLDTTPGTITENGSVMDTAATAGTGWFPIYYKVAKRTSSPVGSCYSTGTGAVNSYRNRSTSADGSGSLTRIGDQMATISYGSVTSAGNQLASHWTVDAEL